MSPHSLIAHHPWWAMLLAFVFILGTSIDLFANDGCRSPLLLVDAAKSSKYVKRVLERREELLYKIALARPRSTKTCSTTRFVQLAYNYGRSGNHFMQFANMIWVSEVTQRTLIIPRDMVYDNPHNAFRPSLAAFNLSTIHQRFCVILSSDPHPTTDVVSLGVEAFNLQDHVYKVDNLARRLRLPPHNAGTVLDAADHFLQVYAALWSNPAAHVRKALVTALSTRLHRDFGYVAAHKRAMEGVCEKVVNVVDLTAYDTAELPMDHPSWNNYTMYHPLCQVPADFIKATMHMHNRDGRQVFVAYDGQGDCDDLEAMGAVFTKPMKGHARNYGSPVFGHLEEGKWLDMGLAIHADLFLQNPASTYSFFVYVVRAALGLQSVPTLSIGSPSDIDKDQKNEFAKYDIYLRFPDNPLRHVQWVGWSAVDKAAGAEVYANLRQEIPINFPRKERTKRSSNSNASDL